MASQLTVYLFIYLCFCQWRICVFILGAKGGQELHLGGGQEDGIAMKGAQSKIKWGPMGGMV